MLAKTRVKILHAKTGREAIASFINNKPDIVLMDIKMPDLDGYQATHEIKKYDPKVPVIAQTAYANAEYEQLSKEVGCDAYIAKPINEEKLLQTINKFISKRNS